MNNMKYDHGSLLSNESHIDPSDSRLINEETAKDIFKIVRNYCSPKGRLEITLDCWWARGQRWTRNRASMTSNQRDLRLLIQSAGEYGYTIGVALNQTDDKSIHAAIRHAVNRVDRYAPRSGFVDMELQDPDWNSVGGVVWSESTHNYSAQENGRVVANLVNRSQEKGLLSAGYLESAAASRFSYMRNVYGRETFMSGRVTQAQCSITVRHPKGIGSGWGGHTSFDIGRVPLEEISMRAYQKCTSSINPVRIEPGRYQVILEPQAAAIFFKLFVKSLERTPPELRGAGPYGIGFDASVNRFRSKLGLPVVDKRVTITHDPADSLVGTHKQMGFEKVVLVENGVLKTLYDTYARSLNENVDIDVPFFRKSFRVEGTGVSLGDMISSTERGVLVSRLTDPFLIDPRSGLYSGITRDGLWLVENGKITNAIRNFRWSESPLFVLNNIETVGEESPVFSEVNIRRAFSGGFANSLSNIVVPSLKVNDFSFVSTTDAI